MISAPIASFFAFRTRSTDLLPATPSRIRRVRRHLWGLRMANWILARRGRWPEKDAGSDPFAAQAPLFASGVAASVPFSLLTQSRTLA